MGVYRAALNVPVLRFGKTATLDDNDPLVKHWTESGALVRLDGPKPKPKAKPKAEAKPAPVEEKKADEKVEEKAEKPDLGVSSVNENIFGIKFDDD